MVVRKKVREIVTLNEETHQGENQGPQGVGHVQHLAHHHVVGNHAAAEDHGDEHHNGQKAIELITGRRARSPSGW